MELRLNFQKEDWCETGLRALRNGLALVGVPEENLRELVGRAEAEGLAVRVERDGDRWRVEPTADASG